jgi:hypothetical protein
MALEGGGGETQKTQLGLLFAGSVAKLPQN